MKKTRVYVVTSGCYSDYHIDTIFSTRQLAQEFINKAAEAANYNEGFNFDRYIGGFNGRDYFIEERVLDEESAVVVHTRWHVRILCDTGAVIGEVTSRRTNERKHSGKAIIVKSVPILKGKDAIDAESCRSAKHAMKLAVEARQAWLRDKK